MEFRTITWKVDLEIQRIGIDEIEHISKEFQTFERAQKEAQKIISDQFSNNINLAPYLKELRKGTHISYRNAIADFMEQLLSSGLIFNSRKEIPSSIYRKDYPPDIHNKYRDMKIWRDDSGNQIKDTEVECEEKEFKIFGAPYPEVITFECLYGAHPKINTNIVFLDKNTANSYKHLTFQFKYLKKSELERGQVFNCKVTLDSNFKKNKSRYSALILDLLNRSNRPLKQCEIVKAIKLDRKTVWRNINALIQSGTEIQKDENGGYYIPKKDAVLSHEDIEIIKRSIVLNPNVSIEEKERLLALLSKIL